MLSRTSAKDDPKHQSHDESVGRKPGALCLKENIMDEWHKGLPDKKGWYRCRLDGEEMRLYFFICELNPRKRYWNDETGARIDDDEIEWKEPR